MTQINMESTALAAPTSPGDVACALTVQTICEMLEKDVLEGGSNSDTDAGQPIKKIESAMASWCFNHIGRILSAYARGDMDEVTILMEQARSERPSVTDLGEIDMLVVIAALFSSWASVPLGDSMGMIGMLKDASPTLLANKAITIQAASPKGHQQTSALRHTNMNRQQHRTQGTGHPKANPKKKKAKKRR